MGLLFNSSTRSKRCFMRARVAWLLLLGAAFLLAAFTYCTFPTTYVQISPHLESILVRCAALDEPAGFADISAMGAWMEREESERWEGGNATLIRNATIWTGARNGTELVYGDLLLHKGVLKALGYVPRRLLARFDLPESVAARYNITTHLRDAKDKEGLDIVDARGGWVTPGLVDLHTHIGLDPAPQLAGSDSTNSPHGPISPPLRSLDGFNTHDDARALALAGGVTSGLVLPGSGNAIAGQAYVVKFRKTRGRSPSTMVLEPPPELHVNASAAAGRRPWRYLKQACGESLIQWGTRMDSAWNVRAAYEQARRIRDAQDEYCAAARSGELYDVRGNAVKEFPEDMRLDVLVDVLRGRVKVNVHCYEAVDLDSLVRLSNEFKFPIAAIHHAAEAWLVPDLLKEAYSAPPTLALFATTARYKREALRASEFAPRVLADAGFAVVMKTDHPIVNERYLLHEAQQAHHFGLPAHLALAAVTSTSARTAGMDHRIGVLREGGDADVVVWKGGVHPLQIGAIPSGVWVDGERVIPAFPEDGGVAWYPDYDGKPGEEPMEPKERRAEPEVPDYDKERKEAVRWEGLPPLEGKKVEGRVVFTGVKVKGGKGTSGEDVVVVEGGRVVCRGSCEEFAGGAAEVVELKGGSIAPALMTFGSPLGVEEILLERSTGDGALYDPFAGNVPKIMGDSAGVVRAVDTLQFGTRNALYAHRHGVALATTSLQRHTFFGLESLAPSVSASFRTGARHALERGAVVRAVAALHVTVGRPGPVEGAPATALSVQIAALRRMLLGGLGDGEQGEGGARWFKEAAEGTIPFVVDVGSVDVMATLLRLKDEVEEKRGTTMRMVFSRATEAHLLADEIAQARVGVILIPWRPYPETWDDRRILPGPPLTNATALMTLLDAGVLVGIGQREGEKPRNARFELAWAALEVGEEVALEMFSKNLESMLGVYGPEAELEGERDVVVYEGGSVFDMGSKAVAVVSPARGVVELL